MVQAGDGAVSAVLRSIRQSPLLSAATIAALWGPDSTPASSASSTAGPFWARVSTILRRSPEPADHSGPLCAPAEACRTSAGATIALLCRARDRLPVPYEALRTPPSAPGPRRRTAVAGGGDDIGGGLNIFLAHAIGVRGDIRHAAGRHTRPVQQRSDRLLARQRRTHTAVLKHHETHERPVALRRVLRAPRVCFLGQRTPQPIS